MGAGLWLHSERITKLHVDTTWGMEGWDLEHSEWRFSARNGLWLSKAVWRQSFRRASSIICRAWFIWNHNRLDSCITSDGCQRGAQWAEAHNSATASSVRTTSNDAAIGTTSDDATVAVTVRHFLTWIITELWPRQPHGRLQPIPATTSHIIIIRN